MEAGWDLWICVGPDSAPIKWCWHWGSGDRVKQSRGGGPEGCCPSTATLCAGCSAQVLESRRVHTSLQLFGQTQTALVCQGAKRAPPKERDGGWGDGIIGWGPLSLLNTSILCLSVLPPTPPPLTPSCQDPRSFSASLDCQQERKSGEEGPGGRRCRLGPAAQSQPLPRVAPRRTGLVVASVPLEGWSRAVWEGSCIFLHPNGGSEGNTSPWA